MTKSTWIATVTSVIFVIAAASGIEASNATAGSARADVGLSPPMAVTPVASLVLPCTAYSLSGSVAWQGAAGSRIGLATVASKSLRGCTLRGFPLVSIKNRGKILKVTEVRDKLYPVKTIRLVLRGKAHVQVRWSNWCGKKLTGTLPLIINFGKTGGKLKLPDKTGKFKVGPPPCNGPKLKSTIHVPPWAAGG